MNLSELDGVTAIVRADFGETPAMTQARAWEFLRCLSSSATNEGEAMAAARMRVYERFLGCRYATQMAAAAAAERSAK
jgi:hypothetical protein